MILIFKSCHFQYKPCAFCTKHAVCWLLLSGRTLCLACFESRNPPDYHYILPLFQRAIQEFEHRGLMPVADVPIERMLAPTDIAWIRSLS